MTKLREGLAIVEDEYLEEMKDAKDRDAVLKHELVNIRSDLPESVILVFEGDEDKIVYFQWINRINPDFDYEPLPQRGKKKVLNLRDVVLRDKNNLSSGIYFFIDRDFDDLGGFAAHHNTFITDMYSVENYLVSREVLDLFLINEFHCHGKPKVRAEITKHFEGVFEQFLDATECINFRIYKGRKLNIHIPAIPEKLNSIAEVSLLEVKAISSPPSEIIKLNREPTQDEINSVEEDFRGLTRAERFRGKFILKFFERWLKELAKDYSADEPVFFKDIVRTSNAKVAEITLGTMASRSTHPAGLSEFINSMRPPVQPVEKTA
ncbi:DUF4435 domain-containing protein [Rhizobium leucaenae]|uniref:DUF4435 domain-containing protein n=1 Tax=Rhizobium leucaenae TaxID=29450 RepID=A0A7W6ZZW1_9HYPH|nr:DUF4435 domain-containing protein [Rhizobium leucaenae]MBB4571691.1 hypothetical protein [Rhizobium leucaenae]